MNIKVLLAVFQRNFISYFANPTGYAFICVFVVLSSSAAFLPDEFFNTNLANLDQLNKWFPFIMLVFIPAITMSVWADERRQGTDELLLTIPAGDFDIVLGKYLAAVAIFEVALAFSLVCNLWVLSRLGEPDVGLLLATYVGYWLIGLAMLAVGMVASFLTSNLTVAYIVGAILNAPLVFFIWADSLFGREVGLDIKEWSIGSQFADFGRGIVDMANLVYFLAIAAVMLYLSVVFIGRRHWRAGASSLPHYVLYVVQVMALLVIGANLCLLTSRASVRGDMTEERLSSLSSSTVELLANLDIEQPVQIDAFISPEVPQDYVQTRLDMLAMLRELKSRGGKKVVLRLNSTEQFSEEAARAEQRYGIGPRRVMTMERGVPRDDQIFLGVAFTCGLEKVILPFLDRGLPVEYELVRSICTVTQQKRQKIGIVQTDAQLYGQFNMQMMSSTPDWPIIAELEKQYDVERVNPAEPISDEYDVLLAVQPSSLGPPEMENFLTAVRSGIPTAIFEDPFPAFAQGVPPTGAPRAPAGGGNPMFGGQQQPQPKGDLGALWGMLGVTFTDRQIICQDYNPIPMLANLEREFVFSDNDAGPNPAFNESNPVSSGLQQLLFPFPGAMSKLNVSELEFTPLVYTGDKTGTVAFDELMFSPFGPMGRPQLNPHRKPIPTEIEYVLAAAIEGSLPSALPAVDAEESEPAPEEVTLKAVLVADIDMLTEPFFRLREQGSIPGAGVRFDFDNVTFVLNILDSLADDTRFLDIRKRRPKYRTLTQIEKQTKTARKQRDETRDELQEKFEKSVADAQAEMDKSIRDLQERIDNEGMSSNDILTQVAMAQTDGQRRLGQQRDELQREMARKLTKIETDLNSEIRRVQNRHKFWAVALPPILPLLLAIVVFFIRRSQEKEGVARSRLR